MQTCPQATPPQGLVGQELAVLAAHKLSNCLFRHQHPPIVPLVLTMRSSIATATVPPRKPVNKSFTVKAESQEVHFDDEHDKFFWTYTEEPHRTRRMAIIKAHPEVRHRI